MKTKIILIGVFLASVAGTSCSSAFYSSAGYNNDDLYALHDKTEIARKQQAEAEARKAAAEARRAEWEARLAEAQASAAQNNYYKQTESPNLENVLADTYESAYARRLRGFESPTYRMPSSYFNFRYGPAFTYVSAYDPAFYNIVISGDEVWVEPKYITSMFGTWGTTVYVDPWYYGWTRPYWGVWGPSFSIGSWGWSFGFNTWYDPLWHPRWYHGHPHWHHHWAGPAWRPSRPHNYRLDSYNRGGVNYRGSGYNTGRGGSYNTGRGQKINDKQYNSRGNSGNKNNNYNSGRKNNNNRGSSYNSNRNSSYNNNRGNSYNSGGFGGSRSSGYSGGGNSSGGGRRYNSGR